MIRFLDHWEYWFNILRELGTSLRIIYVALYLLNFVSGSFSFYRGILLLLRDTKEFILAIEPQRECSLKVQLLYAAVSIKWYIYYS